MRRINYRTVRDNRIKLFGKTLGNENLKNWELDGKRFCFMPYNSVFAEQGLTALWGTERLSKAIRADEVENDIPEMLSPQQRESLEAHEEDKRILAPDGFIRWYFWKEIN